MSAPGQLQLSGARKAAILLSLLGDEPAATLLQMCIRDRPRPLRLTPRSMA